MDPHRQEQASGQPSFVASVDSTRIGYWCIGAGPRIAFFHGLTANHRSWQPVADRLSDVYTACTVDRRGRGVSGDAQPYAFEREFDDVVAIADAIGPTTILGHSLSGPLALEAALRTDAISAVIVYEGWGSAQPVATDEELAELDALVAAERLEDVLFYGDSPEEIERTQALPDFAERVAAAATVPREIRGFDGYWQAHLHDERWATVPVPVLLLIGELTREMVEPAAVELASRLPNVSIRVLPGQGHFAYVTAPDLVADEIRGWLASL
jgi:pimeloyl-ACP methyl ester carboxylesterase